MNHCQRCARDVPDGAMLCDVCASAVPSDPVDDLFRSESPDATPESTPAAIPGVRPKGRELAMMAGGVAAGAILVFAVLSAKGNTSATVNAPTGTPTRAAAAPPRASIQKWSTDSRADWLADPRRGAAFELQADNVVQTWFGAIRPSLVVRCDAHGTEAFVFTRTPTKIEPRAQGKTVTVSVDGEPVRTEHWPDADDHNALFAPDGASFAKRLRHAQTLQFGYTPHNSAAVVARFHVAGLDELVAPAIKTCGWSR